MICGRCGLIAGATTDRVMWGFVIYVSLMPATTTSPGDDALHGTFPRASHCFIFFTQTGATKLMGKVGGNDFKLHKVKVLLICRLDVSSGAKIFLNSCGFSFS